MLSRLLINAARFSARSSSRGSFPVLAARSVLAVELSRLGDVVAVLPFLSKLKQALPSAKVHLLIRDPFVSLLRLVDIDLDLHAVQGNGIQDLLRTVEYARSLRTDLACSLSPSRRNAIITLLSGSRIKAGYLRYSDSLTPFLSSHEVEVLGGTQLPAKQWYGRENIALRSEKVLLALGIPPHGISGPIRVRPDVYDRLRLSLRESGVLPSRDYILMHPFSGWEFRSWNLTRFVELADRVVAELGKDVLMVCEAADGERTKKAVERRSGIHVRDSLTAAELAVALKESSLFVGNDSGLLHLAAGLGVPHVGIFGPAPPELTGPATEKGTLLYRAVPCSPCDQRTCIRPGDPCMMQYSVEEVFALVRQLASSVTQTALANV